MVKMQSTYIKGTYLEVFQGVIRSGEGLGYKVEMADENGGLAVFKVKGSFLLPMGVELKVYVIDMDGGNIEVRLEATGKGQLMDYGQSQKVINSFISELSMYFGQGVPSVAPNVVPPNAPITQESGQNVCQGCGSNHSPNAKFCPKCGSPL